LFDLFKVCFVNKHLNYDYVCAKNSKLTPIASFYRDTSFNSLFIFVLWNAYMGTKCACICR